MFEMNCFSLKSIGYWYTFSRVGFVFFSFCFDFELKKSIYRLQRIVPNWFCGNVFVFLWFNIWLNILYVYIKTMHCENCQKSKVSFVHSEWFALDAAIRDFKNECVQWAYYWCFLLFANGIIQQMSTENVVRSSGTALWRPPDF